MMHPSKCLDTVVSSGNFRNPEGSWILVHFEFCVISNWRGFRIFCGRV